MGKLTISMAIFNSFLYVYQRVICFSSTPKIAQNLSEPRGIRGRHRKSSAEPGQISQMLGSLMEVRSRCPGFPVDWYDEYMMNIDYKQRAIEQSIIYLMSSKKMFCWKLSMILPACLSCVLLSARLSLLTTFLQKAHAGDLQDVG
jgi:hypothetical protein